ncbi:MAG: type 1 glutamine amidotransferase, partial [Clostridia bacterium]|nr:type 1 glutamine amidotransferase [Clostridia bacterium]
HFAVEADRAVSECVSSDYDGLILPGGSAPEKLRLSPDAVRLTKEIFESGKPVCAICHGPQLLISAGVLRGRRATCYPGIADDLKNAGALYEDSPVVVDGNLVTSRRPQDLPDWMRAFVALLR